MSSCAAHGEKRPKEKATVADLLHPHLLVAGQHRAGNLDLEKVSATERGAWQ